MVKVVFPQGTELTQGATLGRATHAHDGGVWIHTLKEGGNALIASRSDAFTGAQVLEWQEFHFGDESYAFVTSGRTIAPLESLARPKTVQASLSFARALRSAPEQIGKAIYVEEHEMIALLDDSAVEVKTKSEVLGAYLTGGVEVSAEDVVALQRIVPWISQDELLEVLEVAGVTPKSPMAGNRRSPAKGKVMRQAEQAGKKLGPFQLAGRRELTSFFNEHVVDIVADEERYAAMGIAFPGAIILEGPTGCGKTFAVERLVDHLGWPSFSIEASSVASPYIHETSRKVAEIFAEAIKAAPSVIIIDEMDAFLASRDSGVSQHNVEEVAEFLRRIPEASANRVLVIGMTNQVKSIDSAILRRGRFDHVIHVDHAREDEVAGLLEALLSKIPHDVQDISGLAKKLSGRPLSDASFVVREAGRLAAKNRKDQVGEEEIATALARCPSRNPDDRRKIGF